MTTATRLAGALLLAASVAGLASTGGAQPVTEGWPCIQVLQPQLSAGAMWTGPDPAEAAGTWQKVPEVEALVGRVAPRSVPLEEAEAELRRFAAGIDREQVPVVLTQVFAGLFETMDDERTEIIRGIRRFHDRQELLAERIEATTGALDHLDPQPADPETAERRQDLEAQLAWDARLFDERERLLPAVCEQPVIVERRLFALARVLMDELARADAPPADEGQGH